MNITNELTALGLTTNEAKVYLSVLELGEPRIGAIEHKTGLHKQLIYLAASNLERRGLMSIREISGRKHFVVEDPSTLEREAADQLRRARDLVPKLFEQANAARAADAVRIYRGTAGVHQYYLDAMRRQPKGTVVKILGINSERYFEIFKQDETPYRRFEALRTQKKVTLYLLLFGVDKEERRLNGRRKYLELRLCKLGSAGPMDIVIWHDHVGILFYGSTPYVLDILGQETVLGFTEYFSALWKQGETSVLHTETN